MSLLLFDDNSCSQSDSKMDLSVDNSTGVSPESPQHQQTQLQKNPTTDKIKSDAATAATVTNSNKISSSTVDQVNNVQKPLDNRIMLPLNLNLSSATTQQQQQQQRPNTIARTLANSHPLMSPGTDSDSESSRELGFAYGSAATKQNLIKAKGDQRNQTYNFPDVVPASEHHHQNNHHNPSNNHHINSNKSTTTTTTTNKLGTVPPPPPPQHTQMNMLRTHSLDLISIESSDIDADVSQYRAIVRSNLQSVTLTANNSKNTTNANTLGLATSIGGGGIAISASNVSNKAHARKQRARKNGCDDISSLDSISNHSFDDDEDVEHNLASLSPSISLTDGLDDYDVVNDVDHDDDDDDDDDDDEGPDIFDAHDDDDDEINNGLNAVSLANNMKKAAAVVGDDAAAAAAAASTTLKTSPTSPAGSVTLPQYSLVEERRNSRNWQKVTLPDGRLFEIDMRVIEPYKRVLSHGGYLKAGGHNAIVIFCACHLPDRSRADYNYVMDNLFLYVVKTLEQLVTDDYVLIYLHGGCNRRNVPPFPWLKKCYQLLDRRLRKSLKSMYLVHPTFWVKSIVWMARPFVSVKFWRKLVYVKSLEELGQHVAVEKAAIPEKVKQYDAKHN